MLQTELLEYPAIGHPVLDELYGPFVAQIIEKSANVPVLIIVHGAISNRSERLARLRMALKSSTRLPVGVRGPWSLITWLLRVALFIKKIVGVNPSSSC